MDRHAAQCAALIAPYGLIKENMTASRIDSQTQQSLDFISNEIDIQKLDYLRSLAYSIANEQRPLEAELKKIDKHHTGLYRATIINVIDSHTKTLISGFNQYTDLILEKIISLLEVLRLPLTDVTITSMETLLSNAFINESTFLKRHQACVEYVTRMLKKYFPDEDATFYRSMNNKTQHSLAHIKIALFTICNQKTSTLERKLKLLKLQKANNQISQMEDSMSITELFTDTITIEKKSGEMFNNIQASVQRNKVFVSGKKPMIESGDVILRSMSNGAQEKYEVIDPGFHEAFGGIPAGYQMTVKNLGIQEKSATIIQNTNTYNLNGNNSRVNQNAIDNSANTVVINNTQIMELLTSIRNEINAQVLDDTQKREAFEVIDAIEEQASSLSPKKAILKPLLDSLPHVGNIGNLGAAILTIISNIPS